MASVVVKLIDKLLSKTSVGGAINAVKSGGLLTKSVKGVVELTDGMKSAKDVKAVREYMIRKNATIVQQSYANVGVKITYADAVKIGREVFNSPALANVMSDFSGIKVDTDFNVSKSEISLVRGVQKVRNDIIKGVNKEAATVFDQWFLDNADRYDLRSIKEQKRLYDDYFMSEEFLVKGGGSETKIRQTTGKGAGDGVYTSD
jgi:hypothetical protein